MIKKLTIVDSNIIEKGPLIDVKINIVDGIFQSTDGKTTKLTKLRHMPTPITVKALIDTGTANCCISDRIANLLELVEVGRKDATNTLGLPIESKMYYAQIELPTVPESFICKGEVQSLPFNGIEFECIIGRSILSHCTFNYIGKQNKITLSFET